MTLDNAFYLLDIDSNSSKQDIRDNYRWFIKYYHPDNKETGDEEELKKIIRAYRKINEAHNS